MATPIRQCSNYSSAACRRGAASCSPPGCIRRSISLRIFISHPPKSIGWRAPVVSTKTSSNISADSASPAKSTPWPKAPHFSSTSRSCASPRRYRKRSLWNRVSSTFCTSNRWLPPKPHAACSPRRANCWSTLACGAPTAPRQDCSRRAPAISPALPERRPCLPVGHSVFRSTARWRIRSYKHRTTKPQLSSCLPAPGPTMLSSCSTLTIPKPRRAKS